MPFQQASGGHVATASCLLPAVTTNQQNALRHVLRIRFGKRFTEKKLSQSERKCVVTNRDTRRSGSRRKVGKSSTSTTLLMEHYFVACRPLRFARYRFAPVDPGSLQHSVFRFS
jgi:hypothetical protein